MLLCALPTLLKNTTAPRTPYLMPWRPLRLPTSTAMHLQVQPSPHSLPADFR